MYLNRRFIRIYFFLYVLLDIYELRWRIHTSFYWFTFENDVAFNYRKNVVIFIFISFLFFRDFWDVLPTFNIKNFVQGEDNLTCSTVTADGHSRGY